MSSLSVWYTWWYISASSPCQWCCCHTHAIESKRGLLRLLEWLREGEGMIPAWPDILHMYPCCRITQPTGCYHAHACLTVFYSHLLILVGWLCSVIRPDALWWPRIYSLPPGEGNPHHYFVASQDRELRNQLREIPGMCVVASFPCWSQDTIPGCQSYTFYTLLQIHVCMTLLLVVLRYLDSKIHINQSNTVFVHNYKHGMTQWRLNVPCTCRLQSFRRWITIPV